MDKQQLQNKIENLEKQLAELKEQVNSPEFEGIKKGVRQKPNFEETYYFLGDGGIIVSKQRHNTFDDIFRFNIGNYFKTQQEAEDYKENLFTKQALKDIALELNNGVEIDWENYAQSKFSIYYQGYRISQGLKLDSADCNTELGQVYCLNNEFLTIAKDRIGEEKLIKLIKSGV